MARRTDTFVCQNCGAAYGRWQGKCDACGEWNTITEEGAERSPAGARPCAAQGPAVRARAALRGGAGRAAAASGIAEFDRVTGGGFVRGSVLLLGGDPGIGKSTLLIQVAATLARGQAARVYISGEEAVAQVRLRAERLGSPARRSSSRPRPRLKTSSQHFRGATPRLVIIDSIQTMWTDMVESARARSARCAAPRRR